MKRILSITVLLSCVLGFSADLDATWRANKLGDTMYKILYRTNQLDSIRSADGFTLFVPSDAAFRSLQGENRSAVTTSDSAALTSLIKAHSIGETVTPNQLQSGGVTTENGTTLIVQQGGDQLTINGAGVTNVIEVDNGVIYVLNGVFEF